MDYILKTTLPLKDILKKLFTLTDTLYLYMLPPSQVKVFSLKAEEIDHLNYTELMTAICCINIRGHLFFYDKDTNFFYYPLMAKSLDKLNEPIFTKLCIILDEPLYVKGHYEKMCIYLRKEGISIAFNNKFLKQETFYD
jgi:hypothetical protein